jgi:hypothetical protein
VDRIARGGPPGMCRAAHLKSVLVLPAAPAEEAQEREYQDDDQDDPENSHAVTPLVVCMNSGSRYPETSSLNPGLTGRNGG